MFQASIEADKNKPKKEAKPRVPLIPPPPPPVAVTVVKQKENDGGNLAGPFFSYSSSFLLYNHSLSSFKSSQNSKIVGTNRFRTSESEARVQEVVPVFSLLPLLFLYTQKVFPSLAPDGVPLSSNTFPFLSLPPF